MVKLSGGIKMPKIKKVSKTNKMSKTINKTIRFYTLCTQPSFNFNGNNLDSLTYKLFLSVFPQIDYYKYNYDEKELWFEIISYDENHMFATCAKKEDFEHNPFLRQHNLDDNKITPFLPKLNPNEQLESFTFFYIDFNKNRMASISSQKIPRLDIIISSFIENKSSTRISIIPDVVPNLEEKLRKVSKLKCFELKFPPNYINNNNIPSLIPFLKNTCHISKGSLKFSISEHKLDFVDNLFSLKNSNCFSDIDVTYKNYEGLDETVSLFEQIYIQSIPISFSEDDTKNLTIIKNTLKKYLNNHINEY